jgi:hypothetical protein
MMVKHCLLRQVCLRRLGAVQPTRADREGSKGTPVKGDVVVSLSLSSSPPVWWLRWVGKTDPTKKSGRLVVDGGVFGLPKLKGTTWVSFPDGGMKCPPADIVRSAEADDTVSVVEITDPETGRARFVTDEQEAMRLLFGL